MEDHLLQKFLPLQSPQEFVRQPRVSSNNFFQLCQVFREGPTPFGKANHDCQKVLEAKFTDFIDIGRAHQIVGEFIESFVKHDLADLKLDIVKQNLIDLLPLRLEGRVVLEVPPQVVLCSQRLSVFVKVHLSLIKEHVSILRSVHDVRGLTRFVPESLVCQFGKVKWLYKLIIKLKPSASLLVLDE